MAVTVTGPDTVAPELGEVIATVGGMTSRTVTVTAAEVAVLLAASRAIALKVWEPGTADVVSQLTEYGAVVSSAPRAAPSSWNWTPTTATSSDALAETATGPETVEPDAGEVMATVGAVVSGGAPFETVTVTAAEAVLLAASRATALRVWAPAAAVVVSQPTA